MATHVHHSNRRTATIRANRATERSPIQTMSMVVGAVFLLVGIAGFIPGLTTHTDDLMGAGRESNAEVLGLFQTSVLHNIVHLAFGVFGLLAARAARAATAFLIGGGVIYLALTFYGAMIDRASDANFIPVNTADNWLHLGLGLGMLFLGLSMMGMRRTLDDTEAEHASS